MINLNKAIGLNKSVSRDGSNVIGARTMNTTTSTLPIDWLLIAARLRGGTTGTFLLGTILIITGVSGRMEWDTKIRLGKRIDLNTLSEAMGTGVVGGGRQGRSRDNDESVRDNAPAEPPVRKLGERFDLAKRNL